MPLLTQRFFLIYIPQLATLAASYKLKRIRDLLYIYKKGYIFSTVYMRGGGTVKKIYRFFTTLKKLFRARTVYFFNKVEKKKVVLEV